MYRQPIDGVLAIRLFPMRIGHTHVCRKVCAAAAAAHSAMSTSASKELRGQAGGMVNERAGGAHLAIVLVACAHVVIVQMETDEPVRAAGGAPGVEGGAPQTREAQVRLEAGGVWSDAPIELRVRKQRAERIERDRAHISGNGLWLKRRIKVQ